VGADDFKSFTVEKRYTDGASPLDREYRYTLCRELEISGEANGIVTMKADLFSKDEVEATITPALVAPAIWEPAVTNLGKVYIDTTWAGLGGTVVAATVYGFTWKLMTGLDARYYMDGGLGFSLHGRQKREVELTLRLDSGANSEVLRDLVESRGIRAVRVTLEGTVIPTTAITKKIHLDVMGPVDPVGAESDRDGDDTLEITVRSRYDPTGAQDFRCIAVNAATALT
jgi:hypothetical protein